MSMAPVAAAISGNSSGATKSKIQFIAWPGPAMKPSSDIDLFTTTLPFPVLVSLTLFLRSSSTHDLRPTGRRAQGRTRGDSDAGAGFGEELNQGSLLGLGVGHAHVGDYQLVHS